MFERTTIKLLCVFILINALVWLPYLLLRDNLPVYMSAPYAVLGFIQTMPVYLLNSIGFPGLLLNNGQCGWGWCSPSTFGYCALLVFWLIVLWLIARLVSLLASAPKKHGARRERD
ncbi:hypothetical protein TERTU_3772 [Teredinibacter turnerae T7901]|uniref:Uncharacterized protein n=1 Tax=Teredinibacter turnerae (strain ATCC 39867 / T7901) TaxID=377629 RepID=C5BST2_TERTT|nr:hypothetical protein TERTU_3772 [Teredinibacter turnerae T7901]